MQAQAIEKIVVGQRVYTGLYALGRGVVYAIHGEQSPRVRPQNRQCYQYGRQSRV